MRSETGIKSKLICINLNIYWVIMEGGGGGVVPEQPRCISGSKWHLWRASVIDTQPLLPPPPPSSSASSFIMFIIISWPSPSFHVGDVEGMIRLVAPGANHIVANFQSFSSHFPVIFQSFPSHFQVISRSHGQKRRKKMDACMDYRCPPAMHLHIGLSIPRNPWAHQQMMAT